MKRKQLLAAIKNPVVIIFLVSLILFVINMIFTYRLRPFNSDDVFWQAILLNWHPFDSTTATLGNSSIYVDKLPFFEFFNHFFEPSRKVLLMEAILSSVAGFTGFYFACIYFLKKAKVQLSYINLLPFVWLSSFGYTFAQLYLNTNWRGFQLGVSFVVFALVAALWYGDIKVKSWWSKTALIIVSAYAGLQMYSDPYFLYFTVGPLALLSILLYITRKINRRQFLMVGIPLVASLVFTKLFGIFFHAAGIRTAIDYPMEFVHFENIVDGINGSLHSILIIFSSDFFGNQLKNITTLAPLLNFVLLSFIAYAVGSFLLKLRRSSWKKMSFETIWQLFFVGITLLVFISHSISTLGQGTATYRYFLFFALVTALLFVYALSSMKTGIKKHILAGLLVVAVLFNLGITAMGVQDSHRPDVASNRRNTLNDLTIALVKDRGYSKGYANYWDANINTYLSGGKVSFLPSVCNDHKALKWHWLINDDAFDNKSEKSFYYLNPDVPAACQPEDILRQFGEPAKKIELGNKIIFLYDYDITAKLGTAKDN